MTHRLERSRSVIESRFLKAGEVLGLAVQGVGQLIGSLEQLSGALDARAVGDTTCELEASAHSLLGVPDRHDSRRERIWRLHRMAGGLRGEVEGMRRHLAYLRVFAINIKVTAAGIMGAGDDFGLFAQEISDRIEAGRVELERFASEVAALDEQLCEAADREQALAGACARLIPAVPDGLSAGAREMASHHEKVSKSAAEVAGLAREIQGKVGAALAALQVGDSTRQRIEHVQQGLQLLQAANLRPDLQRRAEAVVRRLLAAQLAAAAEDFHRDAAQIHQSMAGIVGGAREILRLRELAFGMSARGDGFLERMTAYLGQALELVSGMETADGAARETGRAAANTAEALNLRIAALQAIKTDVQQMALNTTLKCARIGDAGKPLAVIAVELRAHAGHLESAAQATLGGLQGLGHDAGALVEEQADGGVSHALTAAATRVRKASESVEADLAEAAQQGEAVVRTLDDATRQLDFHGDIGAHLDAVVKALGEDVGDAAPQLGEAAGAIAGILQSIAKSYTMVQEREVHAAIVAELALDAPSGALDEAAA